MVAKRRRGRENVNFRVVTRKISAKQEIYKLDSNVRARAKTRADDYSQIPCGSADLNSYNNLVAQLLSRFFFRFLAFRALQDVRTFFININDN